MRRALAFLTVVGGPATPGPAALQWFPGVGVLVGLAVGAVWWGAEHWWPPGVAAALAVATDLVLTGAIHFDGLADSADGLLPPLADRDRRLAAMADPAVGSSGLAAGAVILLLRWVALASQAASLPLVAGLWCGSRTAMAAVVTYGQPARAGGMADLFRGAGGMGRLVVGGFGAAAVLVGVARGWTGLIALAVLVAVSGGVTALAHRRLGGFTGDVLGAVGLMGETAGLLIAAGAW